MRPGPRIQAAAEVLEDILVRHQPAASALQDWGKRHRFAGSGDRAAIGTLVYDVLRRRLSLAARMQSDAPRALAIAAASKALGLSIDDVVRACDEAHAPGTLTEMERERLNADVPQDAASHVAADVPEWLMPSFTRAFESRALEEARAMTERAPIDMRANTLKATREKLVGALDQYGASPTAFAPHGVRIPAPEGPAKAPHVEAEAAHGKGWFEIQDEGSQIAAELSGAGPRQQVLDLCAGAGGKTLALAAAMNNSGQIYAYDSDKAQLRPIFERLQRAGVRNAQVLDGGDKAALDRLAGHFDVVLADAPCSGSGTWRRKPDSKWRLRPGSLATRQKEQQDVLIRATALVKPGGRLTYVTCSILPEENRDQVSWFLAAHPQFTLLPYGEAWSASGLAGTPPSSADGSADTLQLTPASHGTDGFFIACFVRRPDK